MGDSGETQGSYLSEGDYERDSDYIDDRITLGARKPDHGPVGGDLWPVEPGRYRLAGAALDPTRAASPAPSCTRGSTTT